MKRKLGYELLAFIVVVGIVLFVLGTRTPISQFTTSTSISEITSTSTSKITLSSSEISSSESSFASNTSSSVISNTSQSSVTSMQSNQTLTLMQNVSQTVKFTVYGGSQGIVVTNLTFSINSNLQLNFSNSLIQNSSRIRICYVESNFDTCAFTEYKPTSMFNVSADPNTIVNYTFAFTPPIGYLSPIGPGQSFQTSIVFITNISGNYRVLFYANNELQSANYLVVS